MNQWTEAQRAAFIFRRLEAGSLVRKDLMDQFKVSIATASAIFSRFQDAHPGALAYDASAKAYIQGPRFREHNSLPA